MHWRMTPDARPRKAAGRSVKISSDYSVSLALSASDR
jgi:hypothetical protein